MGFLVSFQSWRSQLVSIAESNGHYRYHSQIGGGVFSRLQHGIVLEDCVEMSEVTAGRRSARGFVPTAIGLLHRW
jgi:hypothetical protein